MQLLYCLGCDWTDNGCMFLHQDTDVLNSSVGMVLRELPL